MKNKVIFFGNERLASGVESKCLTLKALINAGYEVTAVVVNERSSSGRKKRRLEIAEVAEENGIPVIVYEDSDQILKLIKDTGATTGVLAAFGRIIKQEVIDAFEHGILNIHPSLLPQYRGSTPIESAILNGDTETGVSLMLLAKEMDAGPTYAQSTIQLKGDESKQELYEELSDIGAQALIELLPSIIDGSVKPLEQDHNKATYCGTISKDDKYLDSNKSAVQLEREVRAYLGWPGSIATIKLITVKILEAEVMESTPGEVSAGYVVAKKHIELVTDNGSLKVTQLQPEGKKPMDAASFINGYLR